MLTALVVANTTHMSNQVLALVLAAMAGSAMAIQGTLNTSLSKSCGLLEASWIVHLSALAILAVMLFLLRLGKGCFAAARSAPWFAFLGGPLNVAIIYLVIASIPRVGVARATTAIIAAQVTTAALIDHLGLLGMAPVAFTWSKGIGLVLLAIGTKMLLTK